MTAAPSLEDQSTERIDPFNFTAEEPSDDVESVEAPQRRKRRTKAEMEAARAQEPEDISAPRDVPMPERKKRGRKPKVTGAITEAGIRKALPDVFACISFFRPQGMWDRTEEECEPLVGPLTRMLNRLPQETLEKVLQLSDPVALAWGLTLVAGPSIIVEIQNARQYHRPKTVANPNANGNDASGIAPTATRPDGTAYNSLAYRDNIGE